MKKFRRMFIIPIIQAIKHISVWFAEESSLIFSLFKIILSKKIEYCKLGLPTEIEKVMKTFLFYSMPNKKKKSSALVRSKYHYFTSVLFWLFKNFFNTLLSTLDIFGYNEISHTYIHLYYAWNLHCSKVFVEFMHIYRICPFISLLHFRTSPGL